VKKIVTNFTRSNLIESSHDIKILIKNINGKTLFTTGNDSELIYPRSSIKIFQAIPFVKSKAIKYFDLNEKKIALSCSSHRGEKFHIKELSEWLKKTKLNYKNLKCGIHNPLNMKATEKLLRSKIKVNALHNNCAGKHLAMITSCLMNNYSKNNYLDFNHPHQISIRKVFEDFSQSKIFRKNYGIDGCSAPQYAFQIKGLALMLINLLLSYKKKFNYHDEVSILINSIIKNPKFIGGSDSLDSITMKISNKNIFCKGGAEGVFLFTDLKKEIVGVIKVADGNERAIPPVIYNLFKKFKIMNAKELLQLKKIFNSRITNHAKIKVGSITTNI